MPTAAELASAFDAAIATLDAPRIAARDDGEPGVAAVLDAAIDDLRLRRRQARGADLLTRWTADRAVKTLTDAGITEARLTRIGSARVDLPGDTLLEVVPAAADPDGPDDPATGYLVIHRRLDDRAPLARYRAPDNPKLVELVQGLLGAVVA